MIDYVSQFSVDSGITDQMLFSHFSMPVGHFIPRYVLIIFPPSYAKSKMLNKTIVRSKNVE